VKAYFSIALILSAVLLTACGGSSGSNGVKPYSLNDYKGRSVSSESLVGTWVSVSTGQRILAGYSAYTEYTEVSYSNKQYFVITETDAGYSKASCNGGYDSINQNGNQISFNGMTGSIVDNQSLIFSKSSELSFKGVTYSEFQNFEMIKISDSVEKVGVVSLTGFPYDDHELNVGCFNQIKETSLDTPNDPYALEGYFVGEQDVVSSTSLLKYSGSINRTLIYPHDNYRGDFYYGSLNVNSESSYSHEISFETEDENPLDEYSFLYRGNIKIKLPIQ